MVCLLRVGRALLRHQAAQPDRRLGDGELARALGTVDAQRERSEVRLERLEDGEWQGEGRLGAVALALARDRGRAAQQQRFHHQRFGQRVDVERGMLDANGEREGLAEGHLGFVRPHRDRKRVCRGRGLRIRPGRGSRRSGKQNRDHRRLPRARNRAASGAT